VNEFSSTKQTDPLDSDGADPQDKIWNHFQNVSPESFRAGKPRLDFILRQVIKKENKSVQSVLNVGVGNGYLEKVLIKRGWSVYSIDPSEGAIQQMEEMGIKGQVGSIEAMPFENNKFDFVVASEVIEHLSDVQRVRGLKEVARVLRHEGLFLGTVPYDEDLLANEVLCPKCGDVFHRWGHQKSFDLSAIREELLPFFSDIRIEKVAFVPFKDTSLIRKIKSAFYWAQAKLGLPNLNTGIYFRATVSKNRF